MQSKVSKCFVRSVSLCPTDSAVRSCVDAGGSYSVEIVEYSLSILTANFQVDLG